MLSVPLSFHDHILGSIFAPIQLVEYGSYDCSQCKQSHSIVEEVVRAFGAPICFAFRHFPRGGPISAAGGAAVAAEAAGLQGMFWEMHDHLLSHQGEFTEADLLSHAATLGLNLPRFVNDIGSGICFERVREMFQDGLDAGVLSTPTFFINGERHNDFADAETLLGALRSKPRALVI